MKIGSIIEWPSNTIPEGFLLCDGSAVSRTTYADLFSVIGTTYGAGDGSTTFNLPDYRDRVPVGLDTNDSDFNVLGKKLGSKSNTYDLTHKHTQGNTGSTTLTIDQIPSHNHAKNLDVYNPNGAGWYGIGYLGVGAGTPVETANVGNSNKDVGGGQGHTHTNPDTANALGNTTISTIQQSIVTNYIIKALNPDSIKISELESASSVTSSDVLPIVQNGETKKVAFSNIIDNGSNTNGSYVKYADGTMICYGMNTGIDNSYRQITFPIQFIDTPYVNTNTIVFDSNYVHLTQVYDIVSTSCKVVVRYCGSTDSIWGIGSNAFNWIAIGKWK